MINKDVTFIYMDSAEKAAYEPIAEEAKRRGYSIKFTDNKLEKCEIGFYCQHINYPQFSKFSVIMLHDIIQQYSNWPNIWYLEPWNKYDIGILPSEQWENNWNKCSQYNYARPRVGMYKIGWPKADAIIKLQEETYKEVFFKKNGLNSSKKTILYAPAWENDGKQNEFVEAMLKLDVNILIKQAPWNPIEYPQQVKNIQEMYELHKDLSRVTILPPATNIFVAIAVSDVLVSEESSTMCEAAMMGIPAVSVSNWLIPDVTSSRLPKCDYEFVMMTQKEQLTDCVKNIVEHFTEFREQSIQFANKNFLNIGKSSSMIMDIIDDCVKGNEIRYKALIPKNNKPVAFKKDLKRRYIALKREFMGNYCVRYPLIGKAWNFAREIKHLGRVIFK